MPADISRRDMLGVAAGAAAATALPGIANAQGAGFLRSPATNALPGLLPPGISAEFVQVTDAVYGRPLRFGYLTAGKRGNPTVFLIHGNPAWSYTYRNMMLKLSKDFFCVAPDLPGFGRSDKPASRAMVTYQNMIIWMGQWRDAAYGLFPVVNPTLYAHDWGGLIFLNLLSRSLGTFDRVIVSNTALPTGRPEEIRDNPQAARSGPALAAWQRYISPRLGADVSPGLLIAANGYDYPLFNPDLSVNKDVAQKVVAKYGDLVRAYNAPFLVNGALDPMLLSTALQLPQDIPFANGPAGEFQPNEAAWTALSSSYYRLFVTAFTANDDVSLGWDSLFQEGIPDLGYRGIPGAGNPLNTVFPSGSHFLQEQRGDDLASLIEQVFQLG